MPFLRRHSRRVVRHTYIRTPCFGSNASERRALLFFLARVALLRLLHNLSSDVGIFRRRLEDLRQVIPLQRFKVVADDSDPTDILDNCLALVSFRLMRQNGTTYLVNFDEYQ